MNLDEVLHLLQIAILATSALFVWWQLRVNTKLLSANHRLHRHNLYATTTEIADDYYATCLMHWRDHFDEETYRRVYEGKEKRCRSYLLMKRKYMYLVFQWFIRDEFGQAAHRWLTELVNYREFDDVHRAHAHYYNDFKHEVDKYLKSGEKAWFCDDVEPDDSNAPAS